MARVIMTCGKICCGKTTYARKLSQEGKAVILSIDEVMLSLFPDGAGELHDMYALRSERYLLSLSLHLIQAGVNVILDWGLWTKSQRDRLRQFYREHGADAEIHYLKISPEEWERRIRKRNAQRPDGSYYVDEGLLKKVNELFQEPSGEEVDLIVSM